MLQKCPLCKQENPIYVKGTKWSLESPDEKILIGDKGYSFCNCKNIFYTDWSNINQCVYDNEYVQKYEGTEKILSRYSDLYFKHLDGNGLFVEIGAISDALLDEAKNIGYETIGIDIASRKSNHKMRFMNFETMNISDDLDSIDVIWASHVFEHFKDPIHALDMCYKMLKDDGRLFIAMPDPFFITWGSDIYRWGHWNVDEHHIMWDRDSFIKEMEKIGFSIDLSKRNSGAGDTICWNDFHILATKKPKSYSVSSSDKFHFEYEG